MTKAGTEVRSPGLISPPSQPLLQTCCVAVSSWSNLGLLLHCQQHLHLAMPPACLWQAYHSSSSLSTGHAVELPLEWVSVWLLRHDQHYHFVLSHCQGWGKVRQLHWMVLLTDPGPERGQPRQPHLGNTVKLEKSHQPLEQSLLRAKCHVGDDISSSKQAVYRGTLRLVPGADWTVQAIFQGHFGPCPQI